MPAHDQMRITDLGIQIDELIYRREYHRYKVDLPDGVSAMVIEEGGKYHAMIVGVIVSAAYPIWHDSMESALEACREPHQDTTQ